MNYIEFTATLKELGFTIPEKHSSMSQWNITSKQLKYVEGIKGCGVDIIFYEPPNAYQAVGKVYVLLPNLKLSLSEITFITMRKNNLWTDYYTNSYSYWEISYLDDLSPDRLKQLIAQQENRYKIINGLHKESELGKIIGTVGDLRKELKNTKKQIDDLNNKIVSWYNRRILIENDV